MSRRVANIVGVALLVAAAVIGGFAYWMSADDTPHRPDFTLADLEGQPHSIADYDGQVVVLNFWASWCKPCREEVPMLIDAQREYGEQGFQILGIAVDTPDAAREFANAYDINYPVLADATEGARIQDRYTAQDAPAGVLPFTAIVDRDGRVVERIAGALDHARLSDIVQPLLEKRASATKD
ncbi:glutathione peroxidase protein [Salinisphaera shabanensis E1L3A]|uniref:Glutathione peroxidase protein n=1 Tax=Salinisphaera shabanensis E1L3A TaxID=1033802 RepID=U2FP49_9GAMM|nr:TlpA disulfide reductase family protein [Salinisphaera shabanensis]ERJ17949.1 glutathione peroxidase protein [Salinisphaera shabanensis E1L3A]